MAWFEDGTSRIYYEEEGSGDPVLVIPGWSLSIDDMTPIRQALAGRYRVIAADAPGSGRSGPQPRKYTPSYFQDDARSLLALLKAIDARPAHIVGFSDGGEYAFVMAELDQSSIRSIAAWGAAGQLGTSTEMTEMFAQVVDNPIPSMKEFSDYLRSAYGEDNARIMATTVGNAWQTIMNAGGDISRRRAAEITCPALLITGERDFLAPPALVSEMAAAMKNATFIEVSEAGHAVHHDSPELLVGTIVEWLAQR
jgi:pimeloyl-ACP methyl ester carboxylesterase